LGEGEKVVLNWGSLKVEHSKGDGGEDERIFPAGPGKRGVADSPGKGKNQLWEKAVSLGEVKLLMLGIRERCGNNMGGGGRGVERKFLRWACGNDLVKGKIGPETFLHLLRTRCSDSPNTCDLKERLVSLNVRGPHVCKPGRV